MDHEILSYILKEYVASGLVPIFALVLVAILELVMRAMFDE